MADAYYLTEEDLVKIRQIAEQVLGTRKNSPSRYRLGEEESQSPEVYVALTPMGGIPALTPNTEAGTGTGSGDFDEPGFANCDIYKLVDRGNPELLYSGFNRRIYNLSSSIIPEDTWIIVARDKFGRWYIVNANSSSFSLPDGSANQFLCTEYDGNTVVWKGGTETKNTAFTVALTDHKKMFLINTTGGISTRGDVIATLPLIDDVHEGFEVWFQLNSKGNGHDTLTVLSVGGDVFLAPGGRTATFLNDTSQVLGLYADNQNNVWIQLNGPSGLFDQLGPFDTFGAVYSSSTGYVTRTEQKWFGGKTFHDGTAHLSGLTCGPGDFSDIYVNLETCFSLSGLFYKYPDYIDTTDTFSPLLEAVHEYKPGVVLSPSGTGPSSPNPTYPISEFVVKYKLLRYYYAGATLYPEAVAAIRYPLVVEYDGTDLTGYVIFDFRSEVGLGGGGRTPIYACGGVRGVSGSFLTEDDKLVTVTGGLITSIVVLGTGT